MLQVIDTHEKNITGKIEADIHVPINIIWDNEKSQLDRVFYWRTINEDSSFLEIGIDSKSQMIYSLTLVSANKVDFYQEDSFIMNDLETKPYTRGLPEINIEAWNDSDGYLTESTSFKISVFDRRLNIILDKGATIGKIIKSANVLFGFNNEDNLVSIDIVGLSYADIDNIRIGCEEWVCKNFD